MRILAGLAIAALGVSAISGAAVAQPGGHLSDVAYLEAARCAGLASSKKLGGDGAALQALLKTESNGRLAAVMEQADEAQARARHEADRADDYSKGRLQAELTGACAALKG